MSFPRIPLPLFLAFGGVIPLGLALVSQYGFGLFPCDLCILQRYPYALVILLAAAALLWRRNIKRLAALTWLAIAAWLTTAAIALYHVGVEQKWWGSSGCTAQHTSDTSIDALRDAILNSPLVSCADAGFVLFGLSMAAWNAVAALLLAVYAGYLLRNIHPISPRG